MKQDMIVILDLGSTENTVLARRIRDLGVYSEIHPHDITVEELKALDNVKGIILNGIAFFSGQIPLSPETGEVVGTTIEEQTEQVMQNVKALLESQGASFTDVVKTTCFLADMGDFAAFNEIYAKYFTGKPARSCVAVKDLPKGVLCEVETIAAVKED